MTYWKYQCGDLADEGADVVRMHLADRRDLLGRVVLEPSTQAREGRLDDDGGTVFQHHRVGAVERAIDAGAHRLPGVALRCFLESPPCLIRRRRRASRMPREGAHDHGAGLGN